jgi:hypothetical protein
VSLMRLQVRLTRPSHVGRMDAWSIEGSFQSPDLGVIANLPVESRQAHFRLIVPGSWGTPPPAWGTLSRAPTRASPPSVDALERTWGVRRSDFSSSRAVAIVMAGTGEQGYLRRQHLIAEPLALMGVATILLESPFYGSRRPPEQTASKLRHLSDLPALGRATLAEGRALLGWVLRDHALGIQHACVAGTSMGGLHAAMTASLATAPVAVASWLGPTSAAPVFTVGCLASACDWEALGRSLSEPWSGRVGVWGDNRLPWGGTHRLSVLDVLRRSTALMRADQRQMTEPGGVASVASRSSFAVEGGLRCLGVGAPVQDMSEVRGMSGSLVREIEECHETSSLSDPVDCVREFFGVTELVHFDPPRRPDCVEFSIARSDEYIPFEAGGEKERWQEVMDRWQGATLQRARGGHVTAALFPSAEDGGGLTGAIARVTARLVNT